MPCQATVRGFFDIKLPWFDTINNNPCGKPIVATMNGVSTSPIEKCLGHWAMSYGYAEVKGAITYSP